VGLRLGGVDVKRIVDCNRRRLGKLAAGGLARDLHHRLHTAVDLEPVPDEEKDLDLFKKSLGGDNGCCCNKARRHHNFQQGSLLYFPRSLRNQGNQGNYLRKLCQKIP